MSDRPDFHAYDKMRRLVAPRSIAIVGASPRPGSFGWEVKTNCRDFDGTIHFVNPAYKEIDGEPCYASLSALPEVPDCVVIAVKRELVEGVIAECAALGIGGALLFASGYAEVQKPERAAEQAKLVAMARKGGVLLAGPNTVGSSNFVNGAVLTFSPDMVLQRPGPNAVGIVSQSGAVGYAAVQAMNHQANISHILVCGNSADIDVADYVAYLADDPDCAAIVCMIEGMADPTRLVRAAEKARAAGKPLVAFKAAKSEVAAAAALSHTGSIAGSHSAYVAAIEAAGAVFLDDHEALLDTAAFLAKAGRPRSEGVGVITASGGWGIILSDIAEECGITLPPLPDHTRDLVLSIIPEFGSAANPCDVTAQILADRPSLAKTAGAFLDEDRYGVLVWPQVWTTERNAEGYRGMIAAIGDEARARGKVACMIWGTQWYEGPGSEAAERNDAVAVFRSTRHCFNAIAIWHRLEANRQAREAASGPDRLSGPDAAVKARALLDAEGGPVIGERTAKQVLKLYGVSVVEERTAGDAAEAARVAAEIGFPVVVKVESPDLAHKSEAGGVKLNLKSAAEVEIAAAQALASVAAYAPDARLTGLLVQAMAPAGTEILVGTKRDPHFGPMVAAGFGGILAEVVADVAVRPAPIDVAGARAMLDTLRCRPVLDGVRNLPKIDIDMLAEAIARISELAADFPDDIAEIDVNPLICSGACILAADGLIVR